MTKRLHALPIALSLCLGGIALLATTAPAHAVEVSGVKLEDTAKVGDKNLVLSGAGTRLKGGMFKVYAMGLYLTDKKTSAADVLSAAGPKRFKLVMLRDVSGEDFGASFLTAINKNLDKDEKSKLVGPLVKLGEVFQTVGDMKKGDTVQGDWVPGVGSVLSFNGKSVMPTQPEPLFYQALLRIWFGDKPVDDSLKPELLGKAAAKAGTDPN